MMKAEKTIKALDLKEMHALPLFDHDDCADRFLLRRTKKSGRM